ncbi:hypothetical protein KBY84_06745 [Cyanobium sp. N.Huapi 1H5]|uniref:hypothetical protein n=1 Tax=Cyanobium sp. N.Huapi 1H5 TaxID=2823719 RepID=UPI0020CCB488|nr:hypothetical protein [Cyanobium sp. N.Huapi 1H5]MCP9837192.1 hypothetical protein [Cyanobium sp. N.Huapi 1H5]
MKIPPIALRAFGRDDQRLILSKSLFGAAVVAAAVTGLSAGSAEAVQTTTCALPSDLTIGDKTVRNIVCNGVGPDTEIRFNNFGLSYDFGSVIDPPTQGGSISYTIFINQPGFEFAAVGLDSGCIFPALGGCTVTKNVSWIGGSTSLASVNGNPAPLDYLFAAGVTSLDIEDIFLATGNSAVSTANNFFSQRTVVAPPDSVPGPLPILGAGMAFGFSRRLRSRVKASSLV